MRISIGILAVLSAGALSQAVAADPPASVSTTSVSTPASSASTAASQSAATASNSESKPDNAPTAPKTMKLVAGDADAEARLKQLKAAGYKAEVRGDQVFFCRKEPQLGSRFERKVCNTAEALEQQQLDSQEAAKQAQRNLSSVPHGN